MRRKADRPDPDERLVAVALVRSENTRIVKHWPASLQALADYA